MISILASGSLIARPAACTSKNGNNYVRCQPRSGEPLHKVKLPWRELDNYAPIPKDWFVKARAGPELVH